MTNERSSQLPCSSSGVGAGSIGCQAAFCPLSSPSARMAKLITLGLIGALGFSRLLSGVLFQTRTYDPLTMVLVCVVLILAAALACLIPARRATGVDPSVALRAD